MLLMRGPSQRLPVIISFVNQVLTAVPHPFRAAQAVWKTLDEDSSGFISAGEFGRFMKKGAPDMGVRARVVLQEKRRIAREALRKDIDERVGYALRDSNPGIKRGQRAGALRARGCGCWSS